MQPGKGGTEMNRRREPPPHTHTGREGRKEECGLRPEEEELRLAETLPGPSSP